MTAASADAAQRLGVTIVIPTFNAERFLTRCLRSIREQEFPRELVEVLIVDGGSTDATREIADRFDYQVVENPMKLAEPGVKLGLGRASHEIRVVMAADNDFPVSNWLDRVVRVFETSDARGVYTHVVPAADDSRFCRYFNLLHADPFNWFVFSRRAHPARWAAERAVLEATDEYVICDLVEDGYPLVALAQAFALRGDLPTDLSNLQDDMLPLWELLHSGERFAYCDVGIHHHTVDGFSDFLGKYRRRAARAMQSSDAAHRQRHQLLNRKQRTRRYLWIPYSLSFVLPAVDAVRGLRRDRDLVWLYHPFACFALTAVLVMTALKVRLAPG